MTIKCRVESNFSIWWYQYSVKTRILPEIIIGQTKELDDNTVHKKYDA